MAYFPETDIKLADSPTADAFGKLRISDGAVIWESMLEYGTGSLLWEASTTGSTNIVHLPEKSSVELRVGTNSGDRVVRQTHVYHRYVPAKSHDISITAMFDSASTNVRRRAGYYDDSDGLFFEQSGENVNVVHRSSVSGEVIDSVITQSNWNIDKLDGTGKSGVTLDFSNAQIFKIDFQWLGAGRVRYGVMTAGQIHYCHELLNANISSSVYMATPNLPIRYEIDNIGATATSSSLVQICNSITSEGGTEPVGLSFSADRGTDGLSVTSRAPLISIRPKLTFNGIANRIVVRPEKIRLITGTQSIHWELVIGGTLTGPTWNNTNEFSSVQFDTGSTGITGGYVIESGYLDAAGPGGGSLEISELPTKQALATNFDVSDSDVLSVVVTSLSTATTCYSSMFWRELQ